MILKWLTGVIAVCVGLCSLAQAAPLNDAVNSERGKLTSQILSLNKGRQILRTQQLSQLQF